MKKTQFLLLLSFLLIPALTVAQTSRLSSNEHQQLRRYVPQMQSTEQAVGQDKLMVNFEKGIPPSTRQALIGYFTQRYKVNQGGIDIYKLPGANNLYFVSGTVNEMLNIFLVLRAQGETFSEVSKTENDSTGSEKQFDFFLGPDRLLIIVSHTTTGLYAGNYAYEFADNNLKSLGEIYVIEKAGMSGSVWLTRSPMGRATAEYKNNTYYVTVRGMTGSLYGHVNDAAGLPKKLAPPRSPLTFSHNGVDWRPVDTRQKRRR